MTEELRERTSPILQFVEERSGMAFTGGRVEIALRQVARRMRELQLESETAYMRRLATEATELRLLVESLAVPETYFFRHPRQIGHLERVVLPPMAAHAARTGIPLTIWSAGCSNGCEPYTLAIVCLQVAGVQGAFPFRIVGTDLSAAAVESCRRAVFSDREVCLKTPGELVERFFVADGPDRWRIRDGLTNSVRFDQADLLSDPLHRGCQLVLCRNVLYYLSPSARMAALRRLWSAMTPGSILAVAPTETASDHAALFRTVDSSHRIYECWKSERPAETATAPRGMTGKIAIAVPAPEPARSAPPSTPEEDLPPQLTIELPAEATAGSLDEWKMRLDRALASIQAPGGRPHPISLDARSCRLLDEAHALVLARFLSSLPEGVPLSVRGAALPVRRFLSRYLPSSVFVSA